MTMFLKREKKKVLETEHEMKRFHKMDIFCSAASTPDLRSAEDINYNDPYSQSLLRTFSL